MISVIVTPVDQDDGGGVLEGEVGEQRGHLRRGHAQNEKGEKADQATVTAPIAAMRGVPSIFRNSSTPCTELLPRRTTPRVPLGKICPVYG